MCLLLFPLFLPVFRIIDILMFLWEKEGSNLPGWNAIMYILHTITSKVE